MRMTNFNKYPSPLLRDFIMYASYFIANSIVNLYNKLIAKHTLLKNST
jgi:hypothetical protein